MAPVATDSSAGRRAHRAHLLVACISGAAVIVLEFAAVRLLAPIFGQSNYVWATVLGWILAALALGYWVGGRWGERSRSGRPLYAAHGVAAAIVAGLAFLGPDVAGAFAPEGIASDRLLPLAFTGSFVASLLLFVVPSFLLGMTSPFLIRLDATPEDAGSMSGSIYAAGTAGSLIGCYVAPLILLQSLGTQGTFVLTAVALAGLSLVGLLCARPLGGTGATPATTSETAGGRVPRRLLAIGFATGAAVTVLEFGAVRFMSPWFGQSNHIWAHVIGVILLAIALGSWVGGRWADRAAGPNALFAGFGILTLYLLAVAWLAPGVLEWLTPGPPELGAMHILPVAFYGSLVGSVLFFGPPVLVLSMATPFLIRMGSRVAPVGRVAGALLAWVTVGGLLGCFLTTPLLVPLLGSRGTLLLVAAGVGAVGWCAWQGPDRRSAVRWAVLATSIVSLGALAFQGLDRPPLRTQPGQRMEVESRYQTIRVVESRVPLIVPDREPAVGGSPGEARTRFLRHDEDAETYQSLLIVDPALQTPETRMLTGGRYFEHMALGAHLLPPPADERIDVLLIGYAGGTVYRTLRAAGPGTRLAVLGVEIDPEVIAVAREHLAHGELEGEDLELITGEDARTVVNALPPARRFDLVLVDAYARTNYLPFQLATKEFFERIGKHLAPGGWVGVNVLGLGMQSPVARSVAATMTAALGNTYLTPNLYYPGNVILWASKDGSSPPRLRSGTVPPALRSAAYALERMTVRHDPAVDGGTVFTDDLSPSDKLADEELGL